MSINSNKHKLFLCCLHSMFPSSSFLLVLWIFSPVFHLQSNNRKPPTSTCGATDKNSNFDILEWANINNLIPFNSWREILFGCRPPLAFAIWCCRPFPPLRFTTLSTTLKPFSLSFEGWRRMFRLIKILHIKPPVKWKLRALLVVCLRVGCCTDWSDD